MLRTGDASDVEPPAAEAEAEQVPSSRAVREQGAGDGEGGLVRRGREEVGGVPRPAARGAHQGPDACRQAGLLPDWPTAEARRRGRGRPDLTLPFCTII